MNASDRAARNRANARHSTGPKTPQGKAAVAQNARRHGATAKLDHATVARWLPIILDAPELTPDMLLPGDERHNWALALAQSEARLVATEGALRAFEAGDTTLTPDSIDVERMQSLIDEDQRNPNASIFQRAQAHRLPTGFVRVRSRVTASNAKQHRLLRRYFREAAAQRRAALRAWVEGEMAEVK